MQPVKMYSTQVCPYCVHAKALLKQRGVEAIEDIRVDLDPSQRLKMMELTGRRTVPQIFIGTTHVGGCDDLIALDRRGALLALLAGRGRRLSPPSAGRARGQPLTSNRDFPWATTTTRCSRSSAST